MKENIYKNQEGKRMNELEMMDYYSEKMKEKTYSAARRYWFDKMRNLWENSEAVQKVWDFISDAFLIVDRFVKRVIDVVEKVAEKISRRKGDIVFADGVQELPDGIQQFYLIRLFDNNGRLVWSKIGTTARATYTRMREHMKYYKKDGIAKIVVDKVWNCEPYTAEMVESYFRSVYMKRWNNLFKKNDRFVGIEFDLNEAEQMFAASIG